MRTQRIWAVFEPRTQHDAPQRVPKRTGRSRSGDADAVIVSQIARLELLKPEERLDPQKLLEAIRASGKTAAYLPDADAIVEPFEEPGRRRGRDLRLQQRRVRRHSRKTAGHAGRAAVKDAVLIR